MAESYQVSTMSGWITDLVSIHFLFARAKRKWTLRRSFFFVQTVNFPRFAGQNA